MGTSNQRADTTRQVYEPDVDITSIYPHPQNPHDGDDLTVGRSIDRNGFYGAIICQASTRNILAGHTRWRSLKAKGVKKVPVIWEYVDDERALAILLADNRTAQFGTYDNEELKAILDHLDSLDMVIDTGYDREFLADLTFSLDEIADVSSQNEPLEPAAYVPLDITDILPRPAPTAPAPAAPTAPAAPRITQVSTRFDQQPRSLILDYPADEYDTLLIRLADARERHGAATNAELFLYLLAIDEEEAG